MSIEAYYGLTSNPFHKSIRVDELFESEVAIECLSRLNYMKEQRGIMLLTGESGTGKTTLLRKFVHSLSNLSFHCIYIPLSTVNVIDFYRQLNVELGGENKYRKSDLFRSIQRSIKDLSLQKKKIPIVILDEVHYLSNDNLFELQIITNFNMDSKDLSLFILSGQPHIRERLSMSMHASLNQRIILKYHLTPLKKDEVEPYLSHHLAKKGRTQPLFTRAAIETLYQNTGGNQRVLGQLAIKTMTLGAYEKKEPLTEEEVLMAAKEL